MSRGKFQLKKQPFIELTVRAYRSRETTKDGGGRGICLMSFQDTTTSVGGVGDDGLPIMGSVSGAMGGVMLTDRQRKYDYPYIVMHDDIWYAFQEALEAAGGDFAAMKKEENDEQA
jgi:hypothetical protein